MQSDDPWVKTDVSPSAISGRTVSLFMASGEIISGTLEVEAAVQGKLLIHVNYRVEDQHSCFRLTQQQFERFVKDGPACILDVPKK